MTQSNCLKRVNKDNKKHDETPVKVSDPVEEQKVSTPTDANTVAEIKAYLDAKGIDYTGKTKKEDLLSLVK